MERRTRPRPPWLRPAPPPAEWDRVRSAGDEGPPADSVGAAWSCLVTAMVLTSCGWRGIAERADAALSDPAPVATR